MQNTNAERINKFLLALTADALFGSAPVDDSTGTQLGRSAEMPEGDMDWQAVLNEARSQQVISLTYPTVSSMEIPDEIKRDWECGRNQNIVNNARNMGNHSRIHRILTEAGIPYVVLKGIASGSYYPDPMSRSYGDVDFLVGKENIERVSELLESRGFLYLHEHDKHKVYSYKGNIYELHNGVMGIPYSRAEEKFDDFFSDIIDGSIPYSYGSSVFNIPSPEHHAVVLLLHKAVHFRNDGVGLRHLCDWAVFVDRMPDDYFEKKMRPVLKRLGLWRFAVIMTDLCSEYLGLRKCSWAGTTDGDYLKHFMDEVMGSGAFGVKRDPTKTTAVRHAAHRVSYGEHGFLKVFINMLNDSAKAAFPVTERKPFLLPGAWVYVSGRHLVRMLRGQRTLSGSAELLSEAKDQRILFDEWKLFEEES